MEYVIQINGMTFLKNSKFDTENIEEARTFESESQAQKYLNHHCEGTATVVPKSKIKEQSKKGE